MSFLTFSDLRMIAASGALAVLAACTHPIDIVGQGRVVSSSGEHDCTAAEAPCDFAIVGAYDETYTAIADAGNAFIGWSGCIELTGLIAPNGNQCAFTIPADAVKANWFKRMLALEARFEPLEDQGGPGDSALVGSWTLTMVDGQPIAAGVFLNWSFTETTVTVTSDLDCDAVYDYAISGEFITATLTQQVGTQCGDMIGDTFEGGPFSILGNRLDIAITDPETEPLTTIFVFERI